jgi:hypothetical protein
LKIKFNRTVLHFYHHKKLASGDWYKLTLMEQLGNIGSEVGRTIKWFRVKDQERFQISFERALELFDLTISDKRWRFRLKEIARSREVFCSLMTEAEKYNNLDYELDSLDKYFLWFGIAERHQKLKVKK